MALVPTEIQSSTEQPTTEENETGGRGQVAPSGNLYGLTTTEKPKGNKDSSRKQPVAPGGSNGRINSPAFYFVFCIIVLLS